MNVTIERLAEDMVAWAERYRCANAPFITAFRSAVTSRDELGAWAAMDPLIHLPTPQPRTGRLLIGVSTILVLIRNMTVFAPVALTWAAIAAASQEFGRYVSALQEQNPNRQIEANFFRFWQESNQWWRLSDVATTDVVIIGCVVVFTILASLAREAGEMRLDRSLAKATDERMALALRMKVALHGRRNATVESVTESLADSHSDLLQSTRDLGVVAGRFEEATVGVTALSPQVARLNEVLSEMLTRGVNDISQAVTTLMMSVQGLEGTVAGGLKDTMENAVHGINNINSRIQATGASVEFGTKQLRDDLDAIHDKLLSLADSLYELRQSGERL